MPTDHAENPAAPTAEITLADVERAAQRIRGRVHRTPVVTNEALSRLLGVELFCKCENLQNMGAFKIRGATNAVATLDKSVRTVATHSSGNHGAALALAAQEAGLRCVIVIPEDTRPTKRDNILRYGAEVVECANTLVARETTLEEVIARTGATFIPPYDHADIIAGAGTAARELLEDHPNLDQIWLPVGGGGLAAGSVIAARGRAQIILAEPELARDAKDSLTQGKRLPPLPPKTIADGLRTGLGTLNFAILHQAKVPVALCSEAAIETFTSHATKHLNTPIEPSAATPFAALSENPNLATGKVGIILTGGNV